MAKIGTPEWHAQVARDSDASAAEWREKLKGTRGAERRIILGSLKQAEANAAAERAKGAQAALARATEGAWEKRRAETRRAQADRWEAGEPTGQYSVERADVHSADSFGGDACEVRDENDLLVAVFRRVADAEGFTACVNLHDELVRALKDAAEWILDHAPRDSETGPRADLLRMRIERLCERARTFGEG